MKRVAVVGATGMIGAPVTNALARAGFDVVALVRDRERAAQKLDERVSLVEGDLKDIDSLSRVLEGADAVYISISTRDTDRENAFSPEKGGLENILAAAKSCGVGRVAYLSSLLARDYGGSWWVMRAKQAGIAHVKSSGIPYSIFYPSNFMENFTNGMVQNKKLMLAGTHRHQAWWIAADDFARQVVAALSLEEKGGREYVVQGPEAMTMDEAARTFVDHHHDPEIGIMKFPMVLLKLAGVFIRPMNFVANLMTVMNENEERFEAQRSWDSLGVPTITVAHFATAGVAE